MICPPLTASRVVLPRETENKPLSPAPRERGACLYYGKSVEGRQISSVSV